MDALTLTSGMETPSDGACPTAESIVRYVLGLLGDEERADLECHLMACPECRIEVIALREAIESIPVGV